MRDQFAQLDDDGEILAACRDGDSGACERIVRRHVLEMLRSAYLLTDNRQRAWRIARRAFLDLFRELPKLDPDVDARARVLRHAAGAFLEPDDTIAESGAPGLPLLEGRSERYQVEDARTRTRAALALLDPPARLALVLREYNGLSVEQIGMLVHERPDLTTQGLESSRRRIRNQLNLRADESLRAVFAGAAFDAPAGDLWPALEEETAEILLRSGNRRRLLSTVAVVVMITAMLGTLALLLRAPETTDVDASETRFQTDAINDPPPFPTIAPPRATGTNPARAVRLSPSVPAVSVPDLMLLALQDTGATDGLSYLTEFRPSHSVRIQPLVDWPRPTREHPMPVLSADGRLLILARFESLGSETRVLVTAIDSTTHEPRWHSELARAPGVPPGERLDVFVNLAADGEHVFATLHYWRESDLLQLVQLDLETGELVNGWPVNIPGRVANDVRVIRPPAGEHVYVFAITQGQPALAGQMHISLYAYEVQTGRQVHGKTFVEAEDRRVFYIYRGQVTADGKSLYGVTYRSNTGALWVQFFDLFTATVQPPVRVPFSVEGNREPVQEAVSHDGRWLYIFSPLSAEVAIVDLEQRQLLGVIALDVRLAGDAFLGAAHLISNAMQISPDGERIYAIGSTTERSMTGAGVWVIDTTTWRLIDHWLPESRPVQILLSGDGETLYLHERTVSMSSWAHGQIRAIDTAAGEQLFHEELRFLPDTIRIHFESLASLYRKQLGRSPVVDGLRPVDNRAFTSLPAIEATVSPIEIRAGAQVTIDVRFVAPLTGELLTEGQTDVRYQSPSGIRAILRDTSGESRDIIIELGRHGYAEYRGTVNVDVPGDWTLSLIDDWSGDTGSGQLVTTRATVKAISPSPGFGSSSLRIHTGR